MRVHEKESMIDLYRKCGYFFDSDIHCLTGNPVAISKLFPSHIMMFIYKCSNRIFMTFRQVDLLPLGKMVILDIKTVDVFLLSSKIMFSPECFPQIIKNVLLLDKVKVKIMKHH